jgi:hypothetical protein
MTSLPKVMLARVVVDCGAAVEIPRWFEVMTPGRLTVHRPRDRVHGCAELTSTLRDRRRERLVG